MVHADIQSCIYARMPLLLFRRTVYDTQMCTLMHCSIASTGSQQTFPALKHNNHQSTKTSLNAVQHTLTDAFCSNTIQ